jgi:hypothetical protein
MAAAIITPAYADDDDWRVRNKVDEEVRFRKAVGLSKARTLGQMDVDKKMRADDWFTGLKMHGTLRASYDAVYDLNPSEYGNSAGTSVVWQSNAGQVVGEGGGINLPFSSSRGAQQNVGLIKLSSLRGGADRGADIAVPVRPCNVDSRGCIENYMDFTKNELAAPEFNERLDFIRELYVDGEAPLLGNTLAVRLGRQQLVWGRTDLFRVLDVVNPVDYSRNNIYDELSDTRIPMGMLRADYRMGAKGPFDDLNLQGVWVWEKFRPNNLGQGGSPNNPGLAAATFRGFKNCWDNGCTVNNFNGGPAVNFNPHQIGIRQANMPDWSLKNTTWGGKVEGEISGLGFSLNALRTFSQNPSLRGGIQTQDPFSGVNGVYPYSLAFDIEFPQINIYGGSLDFTVDPIDTAFRFEAAYSQGEEFTNTARERLFSENDVLRYVIGADKNVMIPALNRTRAFLFSGQLFGQHIFDHELHHLPTGLVGMPDWQDNWIATLLIKGWYEGDTISPQLVMARDIRAQANVIEPSIEWTPSALWRFRLGANIKFGDFRQTFDDNTSACPYPVGCGGVHASTGGASGMLPLGTTRSGIIGAAHEESEIFANVTMRF